MMESENMAGAETQTNDQPGGIEHLAELLTDEAEDAGAPAEGEQGKSGKPDKPTRFNDLASVAGLKLEDLYKLEISQAEDGTPVTIENLKDHYVKQTDLTLHELEFEEHRTKKEAELIRAQEEMRELMAALPEKAIKPEVLQRIRQKHDAQITLERQRTLEVIPTWKDEKVRTADIEGMSEHMAQYGYPVDYLERVADHRQIKYIRDNWQRELRIRKALEKVKAGKPNPTTKQKSGNKAPTRTPLTGVKRGNSRNKLEAVFSQID